MIRTAVKQPYNYAVIHTSKYEQRMKALSCKIFNQFYIPEMEKKDLDFGIHSPAVISWVRKWVKDHRVVERNTDLPIGLDPERNWHYYPAHPQIRLLEHTLREYGLFRDEHRDFNEEMKRIAIARGKVFRERRGSFKKDAKKKK